MQRVHANARTRNIHTYKLMLFYFFKERNLFLSKFSVLNLVLPLSVSKGSLHRSTYISSYNYFIYHKTVGFLEFKKFKRAFSFCRSPWYFPHHFSINLVEGLCPVCENRTKRYSSKNVIYVCVCGCFGAIARGVPVF